MDIVVFCLSFGCVFSFIRMKFQIHWDEFLFTAIGQLGIIRPDQYDRTFPACPEGGNNKPLLFIQILYIIKQTGRTGGLHHEPGSFFPRYTIDSKTAALPDQ